MAAQIGKERGGFYSYSEVEQQIPVPRQLYR